MQIWKSKIVQGISAIATGDLLGKALTFFAFAYLSRVLSPVYIGVIGFGSALTGLLKPIVDYGLGIVGTRDVARDPRRLTEYTLHITLMRAFLAVAAIALCMTIVALSSQYAGERNVLFLFAFGLVLPTFSYSWAYQALGKFQWFAVEKIILGTVYCGMILLWVRNDSGLAVVPAAIIVSGAVSQGLVMLGFFRYRWTRPAVVDSRVFRSIFSSSAPFFVSGQVSQISVYAASFYLGVSSKGEDVGYFFAAFKFYSLVDILSNLLWSTFYPILARYSSERSSTVRIFSLYFTSTALITIPMGLFGIYFARDIMVLLYGPAYGAAAEYFRWLIVAAFFQLFGSAFLRALPAFGKDRIYFKVSVTIAVISVVVGIAMTNLLGTMGAAVSYGLSQFAGFVLSVIVFQSVLRVPYSRSLMITLLCTVISFGAIVLLG